MKNTLFFSVTTGDITVLESIAFKGNEIIVELGSGSGYQIEVLKLYPNMMVLRFYHPLELFLCEKYLSEEEFGEENIVGISMRLLHVKIFPSSKRESSFFEVESLIIYDATLCF